MTIIIIIIIMTIIIITMTIIILIIIIIIIIIIMTIIIITMKIIILIIIIIIKTTTIIYHQPSSAPGRTVDASQSICATAGWARWKQPEYIIIIVFFLPIWKFIGGNTARLRKKSIVSCKPSFICRHWIIS